GATSLEGPGLPLLAVPDEIAGLEQDASGDPPPRRRPPQQELEVHAEVLDLLALGVAHDRDRLGIGLQRDPLLIPANRLGLLGERGTQPREGPRRGRQLLGWLVVLVETHRISLHEAGAWSRAAGSVATRGAPATCRRP